PVDMVSSGMTPGLQDQPAPGAGQRSSSRIGTRDPWRNTPMIAQVRRVFALGLLLAVLVPGAAFAQVSSQANFGQLISALNNINAQITQLQALNNLTVQDIRLVNVNDTLNGNNVQALNNALNRNNVQIVNLQNVLNNQ